jgi:hypothetical protein
MKQGFSQAHSSSIFYCLIRTSRRNCLLSWCETASGVFLLVTWFCHLMTLSAECLTWWPQRSE